MGGCASTASPTANTSTSSVQQGAVNVDSKQVYELKFTDQYTAQMTTGIMDHMLADSISEKTNGRVKFTFYHSESLGKSVDFLNMVKGGVVDAANCSVSLYPSHLEMELGPEIPGLGIPDRKSRLDITWDLFEKGYYTGLTSYKVLGFIATPESTIFLKKKATSVDYLKGLKLRTTSAPMSELIKRLGGTPVTMAGSESYMNLDRGIIDGTITMYEAFEQMKLYEVAKYAIKNPLAYGSMIVIMNKEKWNSLPPDIQAQVDEGIQEYRAELIAMTEEADANWPDQLRQLGMDVYSLSAEEEARLQEIASTIKNDWVAEREAKGLKGKAMMDEIETFLTNYKK
jgi:TRAP-type C4-dicarboxylate transport system substrate-binding protein